MPSAAVQTTSQTFTGSTATPAGTLPTGVATGDLLFVHVITEAAPDWFKSTNGYALIAQAHDAGSLISYLFYKKATASQAAPTFSTNAAAVFGIATTRVSGHHATNWLDFISIATTDGVGALSIVVPGGTTECNDALVIAFESSNNNNTFSTPSGFTESYDTSGGTGISAQGMAYKSQSAAASTGDITITQSASNRLQAIVVAINPATETPPARPRVMGIQNYFTASAVTSLTGILPEDVETGDFLVARVFAENNISPSSNSGYTSQGTLSDGAAIEDTYFTKVAGASEADPNFTITSSNAGVQVVCIKRARAAGALDTSSSVATSAANQITRTLPTLTTLEDKELLLGLLSLNVNSPVSVPAGMMLRVDAQGGFHNSAMLVTDEKRPTQGAVGTRAVTADITCRHAHTQYALRAEPQLAPVSGRSSPDALLATTNLTGALGNITDDPDSPDVNWLTSP